MVNKMKSEPFKFWCQKVLPLVYDDSLSYYELLCKVVDTLNRYMKNTDESFNALLESNEEFKQTLTNNFNEIVDEFNDLKKYVDTYFDNLNVQKEIDNKLQQMYDDGLFGTDNVLTSKKVAFFGDSCTAGFVSDSGSPVLEPNESYAVKFGNLTGCVVHNYAQGGATMTNTSAFKTGNYSLSLQVDACDNEVGVKNIDYIFINFGINDFGQNAEIGTIQKVADKYFNESRFIDAFQLGLKKIYNLNKKVKVVMIIPHYQTRELYQLNTSINAIGLQLESYRNAIINICDWYGLPVVDFRKCGINLDNAQIYHNGDPLHLTRYGYTVQAEYLAKNWLNIQTGNRENRRKISRTTYPLVGCNFFRGYKQNYTTNYINGSALGIPVGESVVSQEEVFLQSGYYTISTTVRGNVQNSVTIDVIDAETNEVVHTNTSNVVAFDELVWHLFIPSNILKAKVKITNNANSEGNLVIGNFDIRADGDQYSPRRMLGAIIPTLGENLEFASPNYVFNVENKVLHIIAQIKAVNGVHSGVGLTFNELSTNLAGIKVGWDVTGSIPIPVNFYTSENNLVANFVLDENHLLNLSCDVFLGNNTTSFDVIC